MASNDMEFDNEWGVVQHLEGECHGKFGSALRICLQRLG
jgi:hypothetical protein